MEGGSGGGEREGGSETDHHKTRQVLPISTCRARVVPLCLATHCPAQSSLPAIQIFC